MQHLGEREGENFAGKSIDYENIGRYTSDATENKDIKFIDLATFWPRSAHFIKNKTVK